MLHFSSFQTKWEGTAMLFLLPGFQNFAPTGQGNVRIEMVTGAPNRKKN